MSLEQAITDNTAALKELISVWSKLTANAPTVEQVAESGLAASGVPIKAPAAKAETKAEVKAETPKTAAVSQPSEAAAASNASKPEDTSPASVTYDTVKALVLKLSASKGSDAARAVLTGLGVAKAPELKPEQFAGAVEQLEAALA